MRILVGYERFGEVREELIRRGHDAWSCDIEEDCSGVDSPNHMVGDIWSFLNATLSAWDALILFPPCTNMCGSGLHWNKNDPVRAAKTQADIANFKMLMALPVPKIIMENPVGILSTAFRKPDVTVQPYMFGEDASKRTCFWTKGVTPPALPPKRAWHSGRTVEYPKGSGKQVCRWSNQTDSGQNRLGPSASRAAERGKTYPGVAKYIADMVES